MKERQTRQLAEVFEVVSTADDHPTAEEVYERVRRRLPRLSLGTVYRNLQKLALRGRIRVVNVADRAVRYDGMVEDHDHFVCDRCGTVSDVDHARSGRRSPPPLSEAGYTVRTHVLTFYGLCPRCNDT
jgi:Fe2+ or Zn2+ uptake regulation protein